MRPPSSIRARLPLVVLTLAVPFALAAAIGASAGGCGPSGTNGKDVKTPTTTGSMPSSSTDAGATPSSDADAMTPPPPDASTSDAPMGIWPVDAALEAEAGGGDAIAGAPCWKGFATTGNAVADLTELGKRCTGGMSPLVGPVKQVFKQGEVKTIPVAFVPACYRIIAVGGTGLKDVDLELKDASGKLVAADNTPNDIFPMIHPNKEFCVDAVQFLNLSIIVKKGAGEVAGAVWKR